MGTHSNQTAQAIFQHDIHGTTSAQTFAWLFQPKHTDFIVAREGGTQGISDAQQVFDAFHDVRIIRQGRVLLVTAQVPPRNLARQCQDIYLIG